MQYVILVLLINLLVVPKGKYLIRFRTREEQIRSYIKIHYDMPLK